MRVFYVDLAGVRDKAGLHDALMRDLPLPDYYGRNLDALHDVLTEYGSDWDVIFYNTREAQEALGGLYTALKRLCRDVVSEFAEDEPESGMRVRFYP
jgi:ribonuclease inhibitor